MPRPIRYDYPGARHHVMNHSRSSEALFLDDVDRALFVRILDELEQRFGTVITAYVLMPNHFHLSAISARGNLSAAIGFLEAQFSRRSNFRHGLDGPRFRCRFTNRLVMSDDHWLYLVAYIHLNPVRARLVADADEFIWSSHRYYAAKCVAPTWVNIEEHVPAFGSRGGYARFISAVARGHRSVPDGFEAMCPGSVADLPAIAPMAPGVSDERVNSALLQVCEVADVSPGRLLESRRRPGGNPERAAALYWLVHQTGLPIALAARRIGMSVGAARKLLSRVCSPGHKHQVAKEIIDKLLELFVF